MPTRPPSLKLYPRAPRVRRPEPEHKRWYKTARWQRRRAEQLAAEPLCWRCLAAGRATLATVANHTVPHRGDADLFWNGKLDSQCKRHHDSDQQREERGHFGGLRKRIRVVNKDES
jgi:hypothetical protein